MAQMNVGLEGIVHNRTLIGGGVPRCVVSMLVGCYAKHPSI